MATALPSLLLIRRSPAFDERLPAGKAGRRNLSVFIFSKINFANITIVAFSTK
ncbi:MAG: hypothetical protein IIB07_07930 [Bacteroidetes bacterium]|nr:hypothetical protein [Bacteroidota bacterium]MCH8942707.1 hypothetical protein [Bacteroidota bacterium]